MAGRLLLKMLEQLDASSFVGTASFLLHSSIIPLEVSRTMMKAGLVSSLFTRLASIDIREDVDEDSEDESGTQDSLDGSESEEEGSDKERGLEALIALLYHICTTGATTLSHSHSAQKWVAFW